MKLFIQRGDIMAIRKTERHTYAQVPAQTAPGTNREKLNHLLSRTHPSAKEEVKSLIKRANAITGSKKDKIYSLFKRTSKI